MLNVLSILAGFSGVFCAITAFLVLLKNPGLPVHRLFFLMALCQSLWCFTGVVIFSAGTIDEFLFWFSIGSVAFILFYPIALHFHATLTKIITLRPWMGIAYIPALVIVYMAWTSPGDLQVFEKVGSYWTFTFNTGTCFFYLYVIYFYLCFTGIVLLLLLWRRRTTVIKEKKQSAVILGALLLSLTAGSVEALFLPLFTEYRSLGLAPLLFSIWTGGIAWAMIRYRFLAIAGNIVGQEILDNMEESVILLDENRRLRAVNASGERILGRKWDELDGLSVEEVLLEKDRLISLLDSLGNEAGSNVLGRFRFLSRERKVTGFMDLRIFRIFDGFGDELGVLLLGREVKDTDELRNRYRITCREMEIIRYTLSGYSNRQIGEALGVTERTVKTHVTNIYNKIGVENRMQLLYSIQDFEIRN